MYRTATMKVVSFWIGVGVILGYLAKAIWDWRTEVDRELQRALMEEEEAANDKMEEDLRRTRAEAAERKEAAADADFEAEMRGDRKLAEEGPAGKKGGKKGGAAGKKGKPKKTADEAKSESRQAETEARKARAAMLEERERAADAGGSASAASAGAGDASVAEAEAE